MSFPEDTPDPFEVGGLPQRDRYGRPLLTQAGGTIRLPYTRASSLATYLAGDYGLARWRMRRLAKGIGDTPEIAELISALPMLTNDRDEDRQTYRDLDPLIERGLQAGGAYAQAAYGTVVHGHTEWQGYDDIGRMVDLGPVPKRAQADVDGFFVKLDELGHRIVATEVFTANDELMAAGTFDHVVDVPGVGLVMADKKTGDLHPNEFCVQFAVYAYGQIYDLVSDERRPLAFEGRPVRTDWGLVYHVEAHTGVTKVYWIDLVKGLERAHLAAAVREARANEATLLLAYDSFTPPSVSVGSANVTINSVLDLIDSATTRAELDGIYRDVIAGTPLVESNRLANAWRARLDMMLGRS